MCFERKRAAGLNELGKMLNFIELSIGFFLSSMQTCSNDFQEENWGR